MYKFRELVEDIKQSARSENDEKKLTPRDKEVHFYIAHGIDPTAKFSTIRMYYPDKDCLAILRSPGKDSPWFKTGKVSPNDKVIIQLFNEERTPTHDTEITGDYSVDKQTWTKGNTYSKNYGEKIELTVDEYKEKIYNNPRNQDVIQNQEFKDLDDDEKISTYRNEYQQKRDDEDAREEAEYQDWKAEYEVDFTFSPTISEKDKDKALRKLFNLNKEGIEVEDLVANPIILWEIENEPSIKLIKNKIRKIKDKEKREEVALKFKKFRKQLFKQQQAEVIKSADKTFQSFKADTLKAVVDWWKDLPDTMKESILDEFIKSNPNAEKPTPIKDPMFVEKALNSLFGMDAGRFLTVPIIKMPIYNKQKYNSPEEDPLADPIEKLIVKQFNDENNLTDNGTVRVLDTISHDSYNMNIGELRELINRQENINSELNTIDYRLTAGNEFSTLNPGKGGKWVDLPDEVVLKMLDTVSKDDNFDFDLIPIIKYYETEKRTGIPNPQVLKALQCYNTKIKDKSEFGNKEDEFTQDERKRGSTIARRITKDGIKYQGLVPEEGHIAVQPGWVSSRFKKYH